MPLTCSGCRESAILFALQQLQVANRLLHLLHRSDQGNRGLRIGMRNDWNGF